MSPAQRLAISLRALLILALSRPTSGRDAELARFEYSQLQMGVRVRILLYAPDEAAAQRAAADAFARIAALEDIMSDCRPARELMRLCARAGG